MNVAAHTDVPIVCLGASAGGLEACQEFFGSMSADTGAAFVVVVHLSPDFKSLMPELIRKCTNMPVSTAEDGTTLLADQVYMIPPSANMRVEQGRLKLEAQDRRPGHALHLPIDLFMVSMAREHTSLCISVILSGSGSDGSRGVRAVKEAGGVVLAQTRESARFDGMPVSACQTGVVDSVGTPKELAARVAHILGDERIQEDETRAEDSQLQRVFQLLSEEGGMDLSYLRPNMVMRRIRRRMTLAGHRSFEDYLEALAEHGDERTHLGNDLLIGVTRFNRDSGAFQGLLTRVLPKILLNLGAKEPCRVWVAGCSTGQEVYTVSMALQEAMIGSGIRRDTRIFATDVSESSLVRASRGAYTLSDVADLPHSWQLKYMEQEAERFVVRSDIRRSVIFARHNLVVDAPFTRIDLVTCRNLLIYLRPELQERVLGSLYLSLKPDHGYLMLGSAEDVGSLSPSLVAVDKSAKIFLRSGPPPHNLSQRKFLREPISVIKTGVPISTMRGDQPRAQWRYAALEVLAEADRRSVAIVQAPHRLVEVITDPLEIFGLRKGPPTDDLTRMLPPAVCTALSAANRRLDDGEGHVHLVSPSLNGTEFVVTLRNLPAKLGDGRFRTLLVQSRPSEPETFSPETIATSSTQRVGELERDLRETKESLQATIEELQAASEEQQSTNEELVASNEELQSTNEELHSVNEELFTVNAEYRQRNEELQLVTADLDNLLRSISVAT
ncbi:MAG: chemotaxis protein CheB, partial [Myxococcota bacterium]